MTSGQQQQGSGWKGWAVVRAVRNAAQDPFYVTAAFNLLLICIWYFLSTLLSIYNKKLLGREHGLAGKGAFPAPLFMCAVQFAIQWMLAKVVFFCRMVERTRQDIEWPSYCKIVLPNGIITGMDIGFSNKSLVYITMSFYTMCKSTVPIFLLGCAFLWGIERPSWNLAGVVVVITSGLVLLVAGETKFDLTGFLLVMSASAMSGVRFTLTQVSLHGHAEAVAMGGPLEVLELLTPIMSVSSMIMSLVWERLWDVLPESKYLNTPSNALATVGLISVGSVLAFLMVWTEYKVIKETSALTFMIAGTCKEVITVIVAVIVFGDKFGVKNGIGLVVVIIGVVLFNLYKLKKMQTEMALQQVKFDGGTDEELAPLVVSSTGSKQPSADGLVHTGHDRDSAVSSPHASGGGTAHTTLELSSALGGSGGQSEETESLIAKAPSGKGPGRTQSHGIGTGSQNGKGTGKWSPDKKDRVLQD